MQILSANKNFGSECMQLQSNMQLMSAQTLRHNKLLQCVQKYVNFEKQFHKKTEIVKISEAEQ